jgi:RND family efflux transporter MFP subunit
MNGHTWWAVLLIAIPGCIDSSGDHSTQTHQLEARLRPVHYHITTSTSLEERVPFLGMIMPSRMVSLHFALAGRLDNCPVKDGSLVRKNEVICRLDTSVVDLEVERAKAALRGAAQMLASDFSDTQKELFESGVIGQIDYEKVRVQSASAKATQRDARALLDLATKKRSEHELRAPWPGRVTGLGLSQGQLLGPEVVIGYLGATDDDWQKDASKAEGATNAVQSDSFRVDIQLHASWFGRIAIGDSAQLTHVAGRSLSSPIKGTVAEVAGAIVPETQMFKVSVSIQRTSPMSPSEAHDVRLAQGMLVKGSINHKITSTGIVIPAPAILQWNTDNAGKVFVVGADDRLRLREVLIGRYTDDQVHVISGLQAGERLVERWSPDLYEGLAVKAIEHVPEKSPEGALP